MNKHIFLIFIMALIAFSNLASSVSYATQDSFTQKDRELLIRLDERLNQIDKRFEQIDKRFEQIDKRFEQVDKRIEELREDMNKRFEQIDKRFEQVDKRFEQVDKRFESLQNLMIAIIGAFAAIVAVAIGFAIWDRRTMIRPFEEKVQNISSQIENNTRKIDGIVEVLKKMAHDDERIASALRNIFL